MEFRSREIGQYLNSLKGVWEMRGPHRSKIYGVQKTWIRKDIPEMDCNRSAGYTLMSL